MTGKAQIPESSLGNGTAHIFKMVESQLTSTVYYFIFSLLWGIYEQESTALQVSIHEPKQHISHVQTQLNLPYKLVHMFHFQQVPPIQRSLQDPERK